MLSFCPPPPALVLQCVTLSEALDSLIQLHAEGVQRHRHQIVLAHREHHVHELFSVIPLAQGRPSHIADTGVRMQLVGSTKEGGVERSPACSVWAFLNPRDLGIGQTGPFAEYHMLSPLIFRLAEPAYAQNQ